MTAVHTQQIYTRSTCNRIISIYFNQPLLFRIVCYPSPIITSTTAGTIIRIPRTFHSICTMYLILQRSAIEEQNEDHVITLQMYTLSANF